MLIALSVLASTLAFRVYAQSNQHYRCLAGNIRAIYATPSGRSCVPLSIEPDFVDLISTPNFLVTFHPGSIVRQDDTVKVWVVVYLASPVQDYNGRFQYDSVKASYKFYCKVRQQLLIQGTYKLGRSRVAERLSNDSIMEEIEPNTIASAMLDDFCNPAGTRSLSKPDLVTADQTDFVCPENLPNDAARQAQLQEFIRRLIEEHPEINTVSQITTIRVRLLEAHHCTQTLKNLHIAE
jgi:hypothetical protein